MDHKPKDKLNPSAYNIFIKENVKLVRLQLEKQNNIGQKVSQTDVMKECGRIWRERQEQKKVELPNFK